MPAVALDRLDTPCLLLDRGILEANAARMTAVAVRHGVALRPHLKTCKSLDVARILCDGSTAAPVTVSTLAEAEYFAAAGFRDILYAVGVSPAKFPRAARLATTGARLTLVTDHPEVARTAAAWCDESGAGLDFLVEVDCGDGRGGVDPGGDELLQVARALASARGTRLRGVMTHAGHSYASNDPARIAAIAEDERAAAVHAAGRLREAGLDLSVVSVGSTPTAVFANSLDGVTEVRAGVYAFHDLDQFGRGVCRREDLALSVLATVIGQNRRAGLVLVDAGGLALSKDLSAAGFLPDAGYGHVCDAESGQRLGSLSVTGVNQEHGKIAVDDDAWYDRLPPGSRVRILPNHACFTAAAYAGYHVIEDGAVARWWPRVQGW